MFGATPGSNPFGATPATPSASTFSFGTSGSSLFGSATPATGGLFGSAASTPAPGGGLFGASTPAFGASTPTASGGLFGASSSGSGLFGATTPAFGATGAASGSSLFGAQTPATSSGGFFGQSASGSSLFGQPATTSSMFGQTQQAPSMFGQPQTGGGIFGGAGFGAQPQAAQQPSIFGGQLTTQMAPVAPPQVPLTAEKVKEIVDAYTDSPANPNYRFRHLFLSVIDPAFRQKPASVSDVVWAEAVSRIQSLSEEDRQRLWPELVSGIKDLSTRLKLQDEAMAHDGERLKTTEANVRALQRHFEADTVPWIQKLRQKEQDLQRRLLHVMRLVEALEGRSHPNRPLSRKESALLEKLRSLVRQMSGPSAELPRRVESLLLNSRLDGGALAGGAGSHGRIDEKSLAQVQALLTQQTEAMKKLAGVLRKDARDAEIIAGAGVQGLAGAGNRGAALDDRLRRTPF